MIACESAGNNTLHFNGLVFLNQFLKFEIKKTKQLTGYSEEQAEMKILTEIN